jgi:hypothetical protein
MPSPAEIARLAAAVNLLRPDWPTASLQTYLASSHAQRPIHDLAVALVFVATDPATKTPKRLGENGPWWHATRAVDRQWSPPKFCPDCSTLHYDDEPHGRRQEPEPGAYHRGTAAARALLAEAKAHPSNEIPDLEDPAC